MSAAGYPADDNEFKESYLKGFTPTEGGYVIESSEGWSFSLPNKNVSPQIGQKIRCYGAGFGFTVRGVFLDAQKVFYKTVAEQEAENVEHRRKVRQEKEDRFAANKEEMDRGFAALPEVFRRRIQFFRDHCPTSFRVDFEAYELFACQQAVLFAEKFKTLEGLQAFGRASYEDQKKMLPGLDENHSGNTFGCALRLAMLYVTNAENVFREHGAMVPLVGCQAYGCLHGEQYGR